MGSMQYSISIVFWFAQRTVKNQIILFGAAKFALHWLRGREHPGIAEPQSRKLRPLADILLLLIRTRLFWLNFQTHNKDLHNIDLFSGKGAVNRAFSWILKTVVAWAWVKHEVTMKSHYQRYMINPYLPGSIILILTRAPEIHEMLATPPSLHLWKGANILNMALSRVKS